MLIKYCLSDNIKAPFGNFAFGLEIAWASPSEGNCSPLAPLKLI